MAVTWVYDERTGSYVQKYVPDQTPGKGVTVKPSGGGGVSAGARSGIGSGTTAQLGIGSGTKPQGSVGAGMTGRDGLGNPIATKPSNAQPVLQGPGMYGPLGSAAQAYGMLKNKYDFDGEDNTPGEMDVYSPLGGIGAILQQILRGSGSGSGGGSKPSISRAVLQKALKKAKNEIAGAYDAATPAVAAAYANNPYAGLQAQETVADPGLSALFQSQGVSTNPLEQMLATNREASSQRTSALNDMYKLMGAQFAQQGAQQQAGIAQQRAGSLDELLQNYAAVLGSGKVY